MDTKRAAIYTRVSSTTQAEEGYSLEAQKDVLIREVNHRGWQLYKHYKDEGISAKSMTKRVGLLAMLEDIKAGKVDVVLIYKTNRLSRNLKDFSEMVHLFKEYDCELVSTSEGFDFTESGGELMANMLASFAQFDNQQKSEVVKSGLNKRFEKGKPTTTLAPIGYVYSPEEQRYLIDEEHADTVRRIFDLFVNEHVSITKMTQVLTSEGYKQKSLRVKNTSGVWQTQGIKNILTNATYIGYVRKKKPEYKKSRTIHHEHWDLVKGEHEPIISEEIYNKAIDKMSKLYAVHAEARKIRYPKESSYFHSLVRCPVCNSMLRPQYKSYKKKGEKEATSIISHYGCPRYYNDKTRPHENGLNHRKIEEAMLNELERISIGEKASYETSLLPKLEDNKKELSRAKKVLERLKSEKKRMVSLYRKGIIEEDELEEEVTQIKSQLKSSEALVKSLEQRRKELVGVSGKDLEKIANVVAEIKTHWPNLSTKQRYVFLNTYIEELHITKHKVPNKRSYYYSCNIDFKV